jgi:hypothetical protein
MSDSSGIKRKNLLDGATVLVSGPEIVDYEQGNTDRSFPTEAEAVSSPAQLFVSFADNNNNIPSRDEWFPATDGNDHLSDQPHGRTQEVVDENESESCKGTTTQPSHKDVSSIVTVANPGNGLLDVTVGPRSRLSRIRSGQVYHKARSVKSLQPGVDATTTAGIDSQSSQQQQFPGPETTITDTIQTCYVQIVTGLIDAMNPKERRRKEFRDTGKFAARVRGVEAGTNAGVVRNNSYEGTVQYRLTSSAPSTGMEKSFDPSNSKWNFFGCSISKSMGIVHYVRWSYQASFVKLSLSLIIIFYAWVMLFAILIYLMGIVQPQCIYVGSISNFKDAGEYFIDAFAISWTTFATVVCTFCVSPCDSHADELLKDVATLTNKQSNKNV